MGIFNVSTLPATLDPVEFATPTDVEVPRGLTVGRTQ